MSCKIACGRQPSDCSMRGLRCCPRVSHRLTFVPCAACRHELPDAQLRICGGGLVADVHADGGLRAGHGAQEA